MPQSTPKKKVDVSPPKWSEVENIVRRTRATSHSPVPNGVPYRLYKYAPETSNTNSLAKGMRCSYPKEKDSAVFSQFRHISLLNVEGKIFFSTVAHRLAAECNHFNDTSVQEAGVFPGCLEHTSMIWHQIQAAKKDLRDLHVVCLDLANAFGSVPHNLLWPTFNFFSVPETITALVKS